MRSRLSANQRMAVAALLTVMIVGTLVLVLVLATSRGAGEQPGLATPSPRPSSTQSSASPAPSAPPTTESAPPTEQPATTQAVPETSQPAEQAPPRASAPGCDGTNLVAPSDPNLAANLSQLAAEWGVGFEAAWYDPGSGIVQAGGLANHAAWSTSKVPLSVAVVQSGQGDAYASSISAALRVSDNGAAAALWQALGPDDVTRSQAVTGVLSQAGDPTQVPSTQLYPPYSIFGQTQWTTSAQVGFMQQLPCLAGSGPVISELGQISPGHSWGLGRLPGATFKGGWGPEPTGGYLVRQLGWYSTADGSRVVIALAVQAGSFEAGVAALDAMAALLG